MIIRKILRKIYYAVINGIKDLNASVSPFAVNKWDYFIIALDYLYCRCFLKVLPGEYRQYNFPYLKHRYRKNFLLRHHQTKYRNINITAFAVSKYTFYTFIQDLYKREMILAPQCGEEAFIDFLKKHQRIIIKPNGGYQGQGITSAEYSNDLAAKQLFAGFVADSPMVCEEFIQQHPVMMSLNPHSVNTLRIVTILVDGEVEVISAVLKIGLDGNSITDNMSMGGLGAQVDIPSGIVFTYGQNFKGETYAYHPVTGTKIIGLQIPRWDEALDLVKTAHKRVPQCALYGWDIAITETGVDIVEGNSSPGTRIMQRMDLIPKGQKLVPMLKKDRLKNKREEYMNDLIKFYFETCKPE